MKKIIVLSAIIIALSIIVFVLSTKRLPEPSVSPSPSPLDAKKEQAAKTAVTYYQTDLAKDKPYQGANFQIAFSQAENAYTVYPVAKTLGEFGAIKKEAEKVFKDNGIADLCSIRIFFAIPGEIKDRTTLADIFPQGCTVPSP